jgi:hypothetical protein
MCNVRYDTITIIGINAVDCTNCRWYSVNPLQLQKPKKQNLKMSYKKQSQQTKNNFTSLVLFIQFLIIELLYTKNVTGLIPCLNVLVPFAEKLKRFASINHKLLTFDKVFQDCIQLDIEQALKKIISIELKRNKALVNVYGYDLCHDISCIFWNYVNQYSITLIGKLEFFSILDLCDKKIYALNQEYGTKRTKQVMYATQYMADTDTFEPVFDDKGKRVKIYESLLTTNKLKCNSNFAYGSVSVNVSDLLELIANNDNFVEPKYIQISKKSETTKQESEIIDEIKNQIEQEKKNYQKAVKKLKK